MNGYVYGWGVLAVCVLIIAIYRLAVGAHEDQTLHLYHNVGAVASQQKLARRVSVADRWGELLTIALVVYGLALLGVYFYHLWLKSYQIQFH
ncbi:MAG TPA: hypothetical protein VGW33_10260 [Terriglobia bacterium]|nr:hypothetical protein [Terriglobia bacterium]